MNRSTFPLYYLMIMIFSCSVASAEINNINYYKKSADVPDISKEVSKLFGVEVTEIDLPSTYYEERNLDVNAILCGQGVTDEEALSLLDKLVELGITVQYFGGYYSAERNALKPTLDIRSYGNDEFHATTGGLTRDMIVSNDLKNFCGLKIGYVGSKR